MSQVVPGPREPSTAQFSRVSLRSRRGIRTGNPVFPRGKVRVERSAWTIERLRMVQLTAFGLPVAGPAQSEVASATCPWSLSSPLPPRWAWGSTSAESRPRASPAHTCTELRVRQGHIGTWGFSGILLPPLLLAPFQVPTLPRTPSPPAALLKENQHVLFFFSYLLGLAGSMPPHPPPYLGTSHSLHTVGLHKHKLSKH